MILGTAKRNLSCILLVGDYGSGKSEVAVNLTLRLQAELVAAGEQRQVALADLDLVNPYFRCREASEPLEARGVRVVMPRGGQQFADLPILLPEVKGLLQDARALSVLDVGGDEVGSRVLAALAPFVTRERTALWLVLNGSRPFNDTVEGCLDVIRRIEGASTLRVTGLVANTHLMEETTAELVREGARLAAAVGEQAGLPLELVTVMEPLAGRLEPGSLPAPLLSMRRLMVPPWVRRETGAPRTGPALGPMGPLHKIEEA